MTKDNERYCVDFFSTLANSIRLAILHSLLRSEKNVTELVNDVRVERTLISHNLALMCDMNLISYSKRGKERIYSPNEKLVVPLFFLVEQFVCPGCSFRKTCKTLRKKGLRGNTKIEPIHDKPCKGCK